MAALNQFTASLWGDEGFSAILSMKSIPEIIRIAANDTSPPLYNITEHLAFKFFGADEVVIRGLSFVYYLIAIFFVYRIGEFLWDRKTGALAALLSFFNPFFFVYAFEGRMYSSLALGVVASMYFFLRLLFAKKTRSFDQLAYIFASLWALYSHHFAFFALFLQGLWFIYEFFWGKRRAAVVIFKAFIFIGILYLPWLMPLIAQTQKVGGGFWLGKPGVKEFFGLVFEYLGAGNKHLFAIPALVLTLVLLLIRRWDKNVKTSAFLATWFLVPILATWLVSQTFQSVFFNRYLIHTIPAAMLLVTSGRRKFSTTILILTLGFYTLISANYFFNPTKDPFEELANYVREQKRGDDFIIQGDAGNHQLWESKYYGIPAPIYSPKEAQLPFFVGTALMEEGDIINSLPRARRIGTISKNEVDEKLIPNYTKAEVVEFGNLKFTWFE